MIEFAQRMTAVLRLIVIHVVDVAQRTRVIVDRLKLIVGFGGFLAHVVDAAIALVNVARALGILPIVRMDRLKIEVDERERDGAIGTDVELILGRQTYVRTASFERLMA